MRALIALGFTLAFWTTPAAEAQTPAAPSRTAPAAIDPARAADLKAMQDGITAFERAFAAGDAKAIAATFTDDAQVADDHGLDPRPRQHPGPLRRVFRRQPQGDDRDPPRGGPLRHARRGD